MGALEAQAWLCAAKHPPAAGTARGKVASGEFRRVSVQSGSADPDRSAPPAPLSQATAEAATSLRHKDSMA